MANPRETAGYRHQRRNLASLSRHCRRSRTRFLTIDTHHWRFD
jgi:hypothetical protein